MRRISLCETARNSIDMCFWNRRCQPGWFPEAGLVDATGLLDTTDLLDTTGLLDEAVSQRLADRFRFGVDVQLFIDAANVVANSVDADIEPVCTALIAVALGQKLQQLDFLRSEFFIQSLTRPQLVK